MSQVSMAPGPEIKGAPVEPHQALLDIGRGTIRLEKRTSCPFWSRGMAPPWSRIGAHTVQDSGNMPKLRGCPSNGKTAENFLLNARDPRVLGLQPPAILPRLRGGERCTQLRATLPCQSPARVDLAPTLSSLWVTGLVKLL